MQEPVEESCGMSQPGSALPVGHSGVSWAKGRVRLECENPLPGDPQGLPVPPFPRGRRCRKHRVLGGPGEHVPVGGVSAEGPQEL